MRNRKFAAIIAGILAAVMLLSLILSALPAIVSADEQKSSTELRAEIKDAQKELEEIEKKKEELESQISANMGEIEKIVAEKNIIDQQVFLLYEQISNINDQITTYGALIADRQEQLDAARKLQAELNAKNKERIRAMEENGNISYWSVLFEANSFSDLLDRLNMIDEIAQADRIRLQQMDAAAKAVEEAKNQLEDEKADMEVTRQELDAAQVELDAKRQKANDLLAQLIAKGAEFDELMDRAEKEASEKDSQIDALEGKLEEAKEREYQEWLAAQPKPKPPENIGDAGSSNYVDGLEWLLPISYTDFSSPFGWRIHPIYGDWRFHYGVDLGAPQGAPIVATRSGVVSQASYDSSSGYHVYINHQDGFVTRYLHMTHYIVSPGQYVAAGQVIGYCGSTGASTGPHLHFSVYYNGQAVNPALFINI